MKPIQGISEDWEIVKSFLPEGWEEKSFETRALVRKRKIKSPEMLLLLLLIHLADGQSLRTTSAYAEKADLCSVNDVALLKRLRASSDWFLWMAQQLRQSTTLSGGYTPKSNKFRYRVVDATMINEPGSTGSDWRLHHTINLKSLHCDAFQISDYRTGESFKRFTVSPGDVLIGDRLYCSVPGISHVKSFGGEVLTRFHSLTPLKNYYARPFSLLDRLDRLKPMEVGDWRVHLFPEKGVRISGRICAVRKTEEAIAKAKEAIRKEATKKQRRIREETLKYAEYFVVFTTLSRKDMKASEILELYRARWQIELCFKRLKSIMRLGHLPKYDPESCKAWLHGKLFVALLVERIRQEAESFSPWGFPLVENKRKEKECLARV